MSVFYQLGSNKDLIYLFPGATRLLGACNYPY